MASVHPGSKVVGLGHHYYVLVQITEDVYELFIKKSASILASICDEMGLQYRSIDNMLFGDPPGVTSFATLEESSLILHTYFENDGSVTFDLTVDVPHVDPRFMHMSFISAAKAAVRRHTGCEPTCVVSHSFDRTSGSCVVDDENT